MLVALLAGALIASSPAFEAEVERHLPGCPATTRHCFGVRIFVAAEGQVPVRDAQWLATHFAQANRHFAASDIAFELADVTTLGEAALDIRTRAERDGLGHARYRKGLIDVYVVRRLDNVDAPGEIRGVHWRSRSKRGRRWVILSRIAPATVLAHELGHFFGLGHSKHRKSLMNKRRRAQPPIAERTFVAGERRRIEARARRMLRSGRLLNRAATGRRPR